MSDTMLSPGWAAIDGALENLYPEIEPQHFGTVIKWMLGGPDPLDGISIYQREDHWHFVSYGMSELYRKESDNLDESGWGFEFTLRVGRASDETEAPVWAANFLQNLARYVFSSGNTFGIGHHLDLNGPIALSTPDTAIRAITFTEDPELGSIDTPHGRLAFLQIVGITLEEYAAIEEWDARQLLEALRPHLPLLVTDLNRQSLLTQPDVATAVSEGTQRDGSSTGSLYVEQAGWRLEGGQATLVFGANAASRVARILTARLTHGRDLAVDAADSGIRFTPGDELSVADSGDGLATVSLPAEVLAEMVTVMEPSAGTYQLTASPGLTIQIIKSHIRDQDGSIIREVG